MDNRQRIIEEAAQMFRTYGIRAVTMDMLASQLGISKRTIYEIFRDKDEILSGVLRWMSDRQNEVMEMIMSDSDNVIEAIYRLLDLMADHFRKMSPAFRLDMKRYLSQIKDRFTEVEELPYRENNKMLIERGIREGIFRDDIDVNIINRCMFEVARLSNDNEIFPPDHFQNEDVQRNFYINYMRGLCTSKGLELIDFYEKEGLQAIRTKH
jgi:AcrR family transcriptional regulator